MGINKGTVLDLINDVHRSGGFKDYNSYSYLFDQVDTMPESEEDIELHWIPVKERNPIEYDNSTEFLVTLEDPNGERYIELLMWDGYEWDEIYSDDNELGIWGQDKVIAWCESFEPYKGVTE